MSLRTRALAVAGAALTAVVVASAPAQAATPESGKLTIYEPTLEWTGEAAGGVVNLANFVGSLTSDTQTIDECVEAYCDTFTVTLEQPGKLEIAVEDGSGYVEMQIRDSAGNEIFWSPGDNDQPTVYKRSKAPAGTYTVEVLTDDFNSPVGDPSYTGYAKLNDGKAVPKPEGGAAAPATAKAAAKGRRAKAKRAQQRRR